MAWFDVAGKTCVAAYDSIGASSLADSYVNEANPGTYDAAPGVAPTWASGTGWTFNGSTQYLTTGVTPANDQTWTVIARVSGLSNGSGVAAGCRTVDGANPQFYVLPRHTDNKEYYANGGFAKTAATSRTAGVFCVASTVGYYNGAVAKSGIASAAGTFADGVHIGARNNNGAADLFFAGNVQAVAIYSDTLTAGEVATLTTAMQALGTTNPGTTDLAAWWSMNAGGLLVDSHGANTLTDNNGVGSGTGVQAECGDFEHGFSQYLSIADNAALSTGNVDFTLCGWLKWETVPATGNAHTGVIQKDSGAGVREFGIEYLDTGSDYLRLHVGDGTNIDSVAETTVGAMSSGVWYFFVAWHKASTSEIGISVNNNTADTDTSTVNPADTVAPLWIGRSWFGTAAGQYMDGLIDEVAFFNGRVLTAAERAWLYNSGAGRTYADLTATNPGTTNLVSWWALNEESGSRADSHGSNTLTDNNTVGYAAGKQGNAADLEAGNTEYLSIADNADLSMGDVDFTIAGWVRFESLVAAGLVSKWNYSTGQREWSLQYTAGGVNRLRFYVSHDGSASASATATTLGLPVVDTWYFVVAWHDATANTLNIQVNNGTVDSTAYSLGCRDGTSAATLSGFDGAAVSYFDGLMDEVCVYKRVLTAAERSWLYNSGAGRAYSDLSAGASVVPQIMHLRRMMAAAAGG